MVIEKATEQTVTIGQTTEHSQQPTIELTPAPTTDDTRTRSPTPSDLWPLASTLRRTHDPSPPKSANGTEP